MAERQDPVVVAAPRPRPRTGDPADHRRGHRRHRPPRGFGVSHAVYAGRDAIWLWNVDANGADWIPVDCTPGIWTHLALVHDGATLTAYQNGQRVGAIPSGPTISPATTPGTLHLGGSGHAGAATYAAGQIDEVRLWHVALDAATIAAWMNRELDAHHLNRAQLAAYYRMSNGSGTQVGDDSGNAHPAVLLGDMGNANWFRVLRPIAG